MLEPVLTRVEGTEVRGALFDSPASRRSACSSRVRGKAALVVKLRALALALASEQIWQNNIIQGTDVLYSIRSAFKGLQPRQSPPFIQE